MSDIEEEQPTQQRGRRDWNDEGDEKTSLRGSDDLGGHRNLVDAHSATGSRTLSGGQPMSAGPRADSEKKKSLIEQEEDVQGDRNPGGDLSRAEPPEETNDDDSDPDRGQAGGADS